MEDRDKLKEQCNRIPKSVTVTKIEKENEEEWYGNRIQQEDNNRVYY